MCISMRVLWDAAGIVDSIWLKLNDLYNPQNALEKITCLRKNIRGCHLLDINYLKSQDRTVGLCKINIIVVGI